MRNQKGITLVALVVTIVVLLILAGVSIAMLSGDNGIITNAKNAQAANTEGEVLDKYRLAYNAIRTEIIARSAVEEEYNATANIGDATTGFVKEIMNELGMDALTDNGYEIDATTTNVIKVTYTDDNFTAAEDEKYDAIEMTLTFTESDVTPDISERQVNVSEPSSDADADNT